MNRSLAAHLSAPLGIALALLLMIFVSPLTSAAQEVAIAPEQPGWTGHAVSFQPAHEAEGEAFLAVWGTEWRDNDQEDFGVYARLVRYPGTLGGIVTLLGQQIADDPAMAFGTTRRQYLVTWPYQTEDLSSTWLWGIILDASPEDASDIVCDPFVIHEYGDYGAIDETSVAYNQHTDSWMVTWEGRVDLSERGLYGRNVFGCSDVGPLFQIDDGGFAEAPSLSYNPETGHFLAVWQSPDGQRIFGRMLEPAGAGVGPVFTVASCAVDCSIEEDQLASAWAVWEPATSRWLVLWSELCARPDLDLTCDDSARVYARFVVDGNCAGSGGEQVPDPDVCLEMPFQVSDGSADSYVSAAAFNAPTQGFFSAWTQFGDADIEPLDDRDVVGRWLTNLGVGDTSGTQIAIHADPTTEEKTPEAGGHVACSDSHPHCLVVLNEWVLGQPPQEPEYWANLIGVFVEPPTLVTTCAVETNELWPPNHKFVDVGLTFEGSDSCAEPPSQVVITVTSDEHPSEASGSGGEVHCPDAIVGDDGSVRLRAERSGTGDGRVYRIATTWTDSCGSVGTCEASIGVPQNKGRKGAPVDSGQLFDPTGCN